MRHHKKCGVVGHRMPHHPRHGRLPGVPRRNSSRDPSFRGSVDATPYGMAIAIIRKGQEHRLRGWSQIMIADAQAVIVGRKQVWKHFADLPDPASRGYY